MFKKYSKTFKQLFSCLSLPPRSEANTSFHFTTFNFTFFSCWKFELGKICSKLKTRAKILINQPNASIFSGCVPLRKTMLSQTFSYAHTRFGAIFFKISKLFKDFQRFSFHVCLGFNQTEV